MRQAFRDTKESVPNIRIVGGGRHNDQIVFNRPNRPDQRHQCGEIPELRAREGEHEAHRQSIAVFQKT